MPHSRLRQISPWDNLAAGHIERLFLSHASICHTSVFPTMQFGTTPTAQVGAPHTFDFLGFTHYCGSSRKGNFLLGRRTSGNKFRKRIKEMNQWLKTVRSACQVKEWWPILQAKLRGHYQYYGVSGNYQALCRYYRRTLYFVLKWLNRSGQKRSFTGQGFTAYLRRYPLPIPKIKHSFYTLSFGT